MLMTPENQGQLVLDVRTESLPLAAPFRISGHTFTSTEVVVVTLSDGEHCGRGEASGVYFLGEGTDAMVEAIERSRTVIERGVGRHMLPQLLPGSGARNAVDCALWELEAQKAGQSVWDLAGLPEPSPLKTTFTLGAESPQHMAIAASALLDASAIKIKLTGEFELDVARVRSVREARADVWLSVDANQGFRRHQLDALVDVLLEAGVSMLEQPLPRGHEAELQGHSYPISIAADESAFDSRDIPGLVGCFDVVNIKLDKCGGLTEGLAMAQAARSHGLQVMVGNMAGSSLAIAPAFLLGQLCDIVDLDGPFLLANDRAPGVHYRAGSIHCSEEVWGRYRPLGKT